MTTETHVPDPHRVLDLALGAGEVLLAGGAGAAEVTAVCTAIAEAGGLRRVECDTTFTSISLSGHGDGEGAPATAMRLVHVRELDYTRVTAVHNLVADLVGRRIGVAEAAGRLSRIASARHPYPRGAVSLARASLAASVAILLGAGPAVTGAAFGATVLVDLCIALLGRAGLPAFYQNTAGGMVATAVAIGLVAADVGVRPALVVAGGIVLLLPGVTLVGAVHDAITGFYVTAAARAFETFLLTAGIISGVAIALSVGVRLGLPVRIEDPSLTTALPVAAQLAAAAVASAAFAVSNYAPRRTLLAVGGAGAVAWGTFLALERLALPVTLATAVGAGVMGLASYVLARYQRVPGLVYVAAGVIPLLPGLTIYRGMRRFVEGDTLGGISLLGQAVSVGLALAAGAILGEFLARSTRARGTARALEAARRRALRRVRRHP